MAGQSTDGRKLLASGGFFVFTGVVAAYQLWYALMFGTVWIGGRYHTGHWESYSQSHGEYWTGVAIWVLCLAGSLWLVSLVVGRLRKPRI